ncbi:uncharacterized protein LOC135211673 [Macrobrachium nipponense]|uniref:uncharacterized protein LOC135211673 n=1 Tax=Macrobrachium nipponense TaxID=159736 RepID=UPI0030C7A4DF
MRVASACFLMMITVTACYCGETTSQAIDDATDWSPSELWDHRNPLTVRVQRRTCMRCSSHASSLQGQNLFRRFSPRRKTPFSGPNEYSAPSSLQDNEINGVGVIPHVRDLSRQQNSDDVAVLTLDDYNGQQTLVYKLAPGAIFGGVRRNEGVGISSSDMFEKLDRNRIYGTVLNSNKNIIVKHRGNVYLGIPYRLPSHGRNRFRLKGKIDPLSNPLTKWKIQYLYPKPPLSSMDNPYLPSKTERYIRSRTSQRIKLDSALEAQRPTGSGSLLYPLAKAVQIGRAKTRGAWLSFLLLHYLGFLPHVPGIPKHKDPLDVMTSIKNTL